MLNFDEVQDNELMTNEEFIVWLVRWMSRPELDIKRDQKFTLAEWINGLQQSGLFEER